MDHNNVSAASARARGYKVFAPLARWIAHRHGSWLSTALALLLTSASYATTYYTYDNLGRVTQVTESNGTTTQYTYDANGNITSITRTAGTNTLSIGTVSTSTGAVGSSFTINGSGFSSIPSQNTVTINGVTAQVTYASDNRLVVVVPNGATSGNIEITTQNGSITANSPFTVIPVSVSSFSPTSATSGTTVTINGGGFDPSPANDTVLINGVAATVTSATATQLQITLPANATPGHLSVTTSQGTGISTTPLFVPASGYSLSQVGTPAVLAPGGTGHVYTFNANQVAVALFDGVAGQRMSFVATNLSFGGYYTVYAPDGSTLAHDYISTVTGTMVNLPALSMAGTFAFYFVPSSTPGTATFALQTDVVGLLQTDGTPTPTALAPGQSATYTFSATAGQSFNLALTPFNGAGWVNATLYRPDGSQLVNCGTYQNYYNYSEACDFTVGIAGTYTLRIVPNGLSPSSFNTFLVQDVSAALTLGNPGAGTPIPVSLVPNQHALLTFTATANQTLALYFSAASISPSGAMVYTITGPGNAFVTRNTVSNGQSVTDNLTLAAGNYTVLVAPYSTGTTASVQVTAASGVTASLPVDGSTSQFQTYVPGQGAYFTFAGTAGQSVGLALAQLGLTPTSITSANISVYKPDSSYYTSGACYQGTIPACQMSLRNLPQTGNYQVAVTPNGQATMALAMTMSQDQTGSLTLGTASTVNLTSTGQNGLFTFTLTGSQAVVLTGASISTTPPNTPVTIYVYDSKNDPPQQVSMTGSGLLNLGVLAAGTYSVLVVPNNGATGSMSLAVQGAPSATLPLDGSSANLATQSAGQNAYVSFSATAGQSVAVAFSNLTFAPSSVTSATLTIKNPDGSQLWQSTCSSGAGCVPDYRGLPQTGTYTITVAPAGNATMNFSAAASLNFTAALTPGTPTNIALTQVGQNAMLSFSATAGQSFALSVAGLATTPANSPVYLGVYNNSGYATVTSTTTTAASTTFNLANLAAGTYVLWIGIQVPGTTNAQVSLQPPQTTFVPTDGSSTNISTSTPGQSAYVTFVAHAGDSFTAEITNLALSPGSPTSVSWSLTAPDNVTVWNQTPCSTSTPVGCNADTFIAPQTGTYKITVTPQGQQTLSFAATVAPNLTANITPGTTQAINFSTAQGQAARFAFTVTSGQVLAISLTGITTTPANTQLWMGVYNPDGSYANYGGTTYTGEVLNITNLAPGNYYLWIGNLAMASATMQLSFQSGITTALPTDGSATDISTLAPGQNAYLKFTGTVNDTVSALLSNLSLSPGSPNYVNWTITAPNGAVVASPGNCYTTTTPGCDVGIILLPSTGTYTVNVYPQGLQTASFTMNFARNLNTSLTSGMVQNFTLNPQLGEVARFTFTVTSGQSLTAAISNISVTPSNTQTWMGVYYANGSYTNIGGVTNTGESFNLSSLAPGTYFLWIGWVTAGSGSLQLSLQ